MLEAVTVLKFNISKVSYDYESLLIIYVIHFQSLLDNEAIKLIKAFDSKVLFYS